MTKRSTRAVLYDLGNMYEACHTSYKGKSREQRRKKSVRAVMNDVGAFAASAVGRLKSGGYEVGKYGHFTLRDGKKTRELSVLSYGDRCVQNAVKSAVAPLIEKRATDDMCAGLKGRGVTANARRWSVVSKVGRILRKADAQWMVLMDVVKFYDSVRNVIVMRELERIVTDKVTLSVLRKFVMAQKSLAIGDPISHHIASLVISPVVRHLKSCGARHLVNYADNFLIVAPTRGEAVRLAKEAEGFALRRMRLRMHAWQVRKVSKAPFTFCGYAFHPNGKVFVSARTKRRYVRSRHRERSRDSYKGMLEACNSRHLRKKVELNDNCKWKRLERLTTVG